MGCLSSTDGKNDFEANEDFDDEEKEIKPTNKLSDDAEMGIPEMNVNALDRIVSRGNPTQPLKSPNIQVSQYQPQSSNNNNPTIAGSNNRRGGQMNAAQSSVLNNFNDNAPKNYDINQYRDTQYNSPQMQSDQASTNSSNSPNYNSSNYNSSMGGMGGVPEHRMMDSHGNVHVNKFYNVTRNHNLSNASKMTDMSEMPSVAHMQQNGNIDPNMLKFNGSNDNSSMDVAGFQHMQNLAVANNGLQPIHKMSIDSATTNGSKMLWDDFSERGSVMTENTSTV